MSPTEVERATRVPGVASVATRGPGVLALALPRRSRTKSALARVRKAHHFGSKSSTGTACGPRRRLRRVSRGESVGHLIGTRPIKCPVGDPVERTEPMPQMCLRHVAKR